MRISDWSSDVCSSDLGAAGEFDLALLPLFRVAAQRIEAFPIFGSGAEQGRIRVEPTQEPGMDVRRAETPGFHAGLGQPAGEAVADRGQQIGRPAGRERVCQSVVVSGGAVSLKQKQQRTYNK